MRLYKRLAILSLLLSLGGALFVTQLRTGADTTIVAGEAWANPSVMALKRIGDTPSQQTEPGYFSNLDCSPESYHLTNSTTMKNGCFTDTAFGQFDSDSEIAIFNGTDEGVQLLPYTANQVLAPWPKALDLVALNTTTSDGQLMSLYKNPLAVVQDNRNLLGELDSKQLIEPADLPLTDSAGKQLQINGQSLAFSSNGSWMVAETVGGAFERINLASLDMTPFAPAYAELGSNRLFESSVTISADGRYVAVENTDASDFKVYDLSNCSAAGVCASYNYWPFIKQQISDLRYLSHVRFINDGLISFDATSATTSVTGSYELAPAASIHSLIDYLGLGDSFSSGEGAFDYLSGSDTDDDKCHLSSHSYPLLLSHDLFNSTGGHSIACSGAVVNDVGSTSDSYLGQNRGVANWSQLTQSQPALLASILSSYLPGYVAQQRFVREYQPGIMTVGVGGNNIGFADILERCAEPHFSLNLVDNTCYATYEDRQELLALIIKSGQKLQALYEQLQTESPESSLYVIGYPETTVDDGNCALNVHFNTDELEFVKEVIDELNSTIATAAQAAGAHYVDVSQALAGHRLCETVSSDVAVNGLTAGNDNGFAGFTVIGNESYHPNALGQELIEQAILKQTNNLKLFTTVKPVTSQPGQSFSNVPKSGRPITVLVPDPDITSKQTSPGKTIIVTVNVLNDGLSPTDSYAVRLDGSQGNILGNIAGSGSGPVIIPITADPGLHTIDITGQNQAGEPVDVTQPIYISSGDGTATSASCPLVANSGQDADHDGIDDACDPIIGSSSDQQPSSGVPSTNQTTGDPSGGATSVGQIQAVVSLLPTVGLQATVSTSAQSAIDTSTSPISNLTVVKRLLVRPDTTTQNRIQPISVAASPVNSLKLAPNSGQTQLPKLEIILWIPWLLLGISSFGCLKLLDNWLHKKGSP